MTRIVNIAAAQLGPIARDEPRQSAVARMIELMRQAKDRDADLIVYPELALTTFFPRWHFEDQDDIDAFFEREMPNAATTPLFELAAEFEMGFNLGYAELLEQDGRMRRFNTSILVDKKGEIVGKYRKVHLPGHAEHEPWRPFQHLEKGYFEPGDLGFPVYEALGGVVGMCICNDRRWPETYRVLGLRGAEMILLGYNTPRHFPTDPKLDPLQDFHSHLVMQAGAYQNGAFVVGVAKAGIEEDCEMIAESCIIAPTGEMIAKTETMDDEVIVAECDLDRAAEMKAIRWNFPVNRQIHHYGPITDGTGS